MMTPGPSSYPSYHAYPAQAQRRAYSRTPPISGIPTGQGSRIVPPPSFQPAISAAPPSVPVSYYASDQRPSPRLTPILYLLVPVPAAPAPSVSPVPPSAPVASTASNLCPAPAAGTTGETPMAATTYSAEAATAARTQSTSSHHVDAISSSSSDSTSSSDSDSESGSEEEAVAGALVGTRASADAIGEDGPTERDGQTEPVPEPAAVDLDEGSASSPRSSSDSDSSSSDSESSTSDEDSDTEHVSDIEAAVLERAGEEDDDLAAAETLPFDFGSDAAGSDAGDDADGENTGASGDESDGDEAAAAPRRKAKRRRIESVDSEQVALESAAESRTTSRAGSLDPTTFDQAGHADAPSMLTDAVVSPAVLAHLRPNTPSELTTSAPADSSPGSAAVSVSAPAAHAPEVLILPRADSDLDSPEPEKGEEPEEGEVVDRAQSPPAATPAGSTPAAPSLPDEISATLSALRAAAQPDPDAERGLSLASPPPPPPPLAQPTAPSAQSASSNLLPTLGPQTVPAATVAPSLPAAAPVPKASYERKRPASESLPANATPPAGKGAAAAAAGAGAGAGGPKAAKRAKLAYKPSPLSKPAAGAAQSATPAAADPAASAAATSTKPSAERAVYVRRAERSEPGTPVPEAPTANANANGPAPAPAQTKAVYQRRADALVAMASNQIKTANGKKGGKLRGALPLTREEKAQRLPPKFYATFGEYATPDAAALPAIYATPKHTVLPARNLAPPNEACLHGFWPGPPTRKQASSKAIFPAPLIALNDDDDDRPRVEVFIDNSNVLYSFLNWVRGRSDAKVMSVKAPGGGKDAAGNAKTVKTVTIAGKKVKLDYRSLFAVLERGRKVERRVIVGSSTLWQSLEPAIDWGYEISLLQRVPRAENTKTSAANMVATANQLAAQQGGNATGGKKRGKNGKIKKPEPVPIQPVNTQSQVKHYKEQAVDELVHLKILQSLLDYDPPPLPIPSRPPTPEPASVTEVMPVRVETPASVAIAHDPHSAAAPEVDAPPTAPLQPVVAVPAAAESTTSPAPPAADVVPAPPANRFQPSAAFVAAGESNPSSPAGTPSTAAPAAPAAAAQKPADPRFVPAGDKPAANSAAVPTPPAPAKKASVLRIVPRTPPRDRPVLVIGTGDANSSEYNPGGFLGCVRRALDRGWDVEIAAFTSGISSLWTGEQVRRFTDDGRPRGELRVIDLGLFGEELVTV
ncbi:hypothetical protein JCM8202v2_002831 [Rhodotorula sphaerocarpa]